ncbi:hypothetical protein DER45DRAFT_453757, partial [Fusarium avenaceum]
LFRNLDLQQGQKILVRGPTSSFGKAAINLAIDTGAIVTATTRSEAKFAALTELRVFESVLQTPNLSGCLHERHNLEKVGVVLELISNSSFVNSLQLVRRDARGFLAGWLKGLNPIKGPAGPDKSRGFNPPLQMESGVYLSLFGSFVFGTEWFPVSDVPLTSTVQKVGVGKIDAKPWRTFSFNEIHDAHGAIVNREANGNMVVIVE